MAMDADYMRRAVRLGRRGEGRVEPNPMVGCVVVKGGRSGGVVGEGWHRRFGGPHAEVEALGKAGRRAKGATVYVTLEPCAHQGKTPPCVDALIAAGVRRVVIGVRDPHQAAGGGAGRLRRAGIAVEVGVCAEEAAELIGPFAKVVTRGLPWVICKWAATVDGAIATRSGESKWISSPASRLLVHRMRARVDAVVVGIGTVMADDPLLTARDVAIRRIARRVVVDPSLRIPMGARMLATAEAAPVTIAVERGVVKGKAAKVRRLRAMGVEVVELATRGRKGGKGVLSRKRLDMAALMRHLVREHGATNVLVEGGGVTTGGMVEQGLCDELVVFVGPRVLGDAAGRAAVDRGVALERMGDAVGVRLMEVRRVGADAMLRYRVCGL